MLARARSTMVDEVVIDLEDSVAPADKDAARAMVVAAVRAGGWRAGSLAVRVNGLDTEYFAPDLAEIAGERVDSVIIPKVERSADVLLVVEALAGRPVGLQLLIETAAGLANAMSIAGASPQVETLIVGYADLAASLGRPPIAPGEHPRDRWGAVLHAVLVAARAAGVQAIDGPFFDIADVAGARAWADYTRSLGYDGKWALHPTQVQPLAEAFTPSAAELQAATELLAALQASEAGGHGAALHGGEMIDEASRKHALGVLARGAARNA